MSSASTSSPFPASPEAQVRNVVLVHGAYADGSSWRKVIEKPRRVTCARRPVSASRPRVTFTYHPPLPSLYTPSGLVGT
jgi:hypothetical protein